MKVIESFVAEILQAEFGEDAAAVYEKSPLLQYLDRKMKAVHGDCKTRRSLANVYAIYSLLHFYEADFYGNKSEYRKFRGYEYTKLFVFCRSLYGGSKLQNHALNSRVNGEFRNKISSAASDLIIVENGKYLLHPAYLYVGERDISKVACKVIQKYIRLLEAKDNALASVIADLKKTKDYSEKRKKIGGLLHEDAEARVFEIVSYAILKNHYAGETVYFGESLKSVREESLRLYKTGRTNANDGGIDFVMRPIGRFFQVTEVGNYDKYLLDIDKVMHFPVTFVIKTSKTRDRILHELSDYVQERSAGMEIIEQRYHHAIEDVITINELNTWLDALDNESVDGVLRDVDVYYRLEMNIAE